jgi:hypothetical protein
MKHGFHYIDRDFDPGLGGEQAQVKTSTRHSDGKCLLMNL